MPTRSNVRVCVWGIVVLVAVGAATGAAAQPAAPEPGIRLSSIPPRPADALGGAAFVQRLGQLPPSERQAAILAEARRGNLPSFLRRLQPVELTLVSRQRGRVFATAWVMPDYLSIGSDTDFVRIPLDLYTAASLARQFDLSLPTRKLVNATYRQATVRLTPLPMTPGPQMRSPRYTLMHHQRIEQDRAPSRLGALTAGHKKDLVLSNRLSRRPPRVAIYGWHRRVGRPIQPLSTVHGAGYADYSHGVRFVARTVLVDGRPHDLYDLLNDRVLAGLVSDEGRIAQASTFLEIRRPSAASSPTAVPLGP